MNKVNLLGRVTSNLVVKNGVLRFSLAVKRNYREKDGTNGTDFIDCVAFGTTGENIARYVSTGEQLAVSGKMKTNIYNKIKRTDVVVDDYTFISQKKQQQQDEYIPYASTYVPNAAPEDNTLFEPPFEPHESAADYIK